MYFQNYTLKCLFVLKMFENIHMLIFLRLVEGAGTAAECRDRPGNCSKNARGGARMKQKRESYLLNGSRIPGQAGTTTKLQ